MSFPTRGVNSTDQIVTEAGQVTKLEDVIKMISGSASPQLTNALQGTQLIQVTRPCTGAPLSGRPVYKLTPQRLQIQTATAGVSAETSPVVQCLAKQSPEKVLQQRFVSPAVTTINQQLFNAQNISVANQTAQQPLNTHQQSQYLVTQAGSSLVSSNVQQSMNLLANSNISTKAASSLHLYNSEVLQRVSNSVDLEKAATVPRSESVPTKRLYYKCEGGKYVTEDGLELSPEMMKNINSGKVNLSLQLNQTSTNNLRGHQNTQSNLQVNSLNENSGAGKKVVIAAVANNQQTIVMPNQNSYSGSTFKTAFKNSPSFQQHQQQQVENGPNIVQPKTMAKIQGHIGQLQASGSTTQRVHVVTPGALQNQQIITTTLGEQKALPLQYVASVRPEALSKMQFVQQSHQIPRVKRNAKKRMPKSTVVYGNQPNLNSSLVILNNSAASQQMPVAASQNVISSPKNVGGLNIATCKAEGQINMISSNNSGTSAVTKTGNFSNTAHCSVLEKALTQPPVLSQYLNKQVTTAQAPATQQLNRQMTTAQTSPTQKANTYTTLSNPVESPPSMQLSRPQVQPSQSSSQQASGVSQSRMFLRMEHKCSTLMS